MSKIDAVTAEKLVRHPIRAQIVVLLATNRKMSPNEMAKRLGRPLGVVAYHVRTLEELGALKPMGTKQRRGATEHFYSLREPAREPLSKAVQELSGLVNLMLVTL